MKSRYVILDANVVIDAHRLGFWTALVTQYKISITETILNEVQFYEDDAGEKHAIDLRASAQSGAIDVLAASLAELEAVQSKITVEFAKSVDRGELEAIAVLASGRCEDHRFCTADGVAIKLLAVLDFGAYGVPVNKLLEPIGYHKPVPHQYGEKYFNTKLAEGMVEKKIALRKKI